MTEGKWCQSFCGRLLPLEAFEGRRGICRTCRRYIERMRYRARYPKIKARELERKAVWYRANREAVCARERRRYWSDPEAARANLRARRRRAE